MNLKAVWSVLGFCCSVFVWNIGKAEAWVVDHWPGLVLRILAWPFVFLLTWISGRVYNPVSRKWVLVFPALHSCVDCFDDSPGPSPVVPLCFMVDLVIVGTIWLLWLVVFVILRWWTFAVLAAIVIPWFFWYCLKKYRGSANGD